MHSRICSSLRAYSACVKLRRPFVAKLSPRQLPAAPYKHNEPPYGLAGSPLKTSYRAHSSNSENRDGTPTTDPGPIPESVIYLPPTLPSHTSNNLHNCGNEHVAASDLESAESSIPAASLKNPSLHSQKATAPHPYMLPIHSCDAAPDAAVTKALSYGMSSETKDGHHLSKEQMQVLNLVINQGKSIFFTGSAGTGKSVVLRELVTRLRNSGRMEAIAVTASTGIAALTIGGTTLHSFAGIGIGTDDLESLIKLVKSDSDAVKRWLNTRVLIIDEVSMLSGDLFDTLDLLARRVRNKKYVPWGGIQMVLSGDFLQLPPVDKPKIARETGKRMPRKADETVKFCFEAFNWKATIQKNVVLKQVLRQKDAVFSRMLNELRVGEMSEDTIIRFQELDREIASTDGTVTTKLFPRRKEVESANRAELRLIDKEPVLYKARDEGRLAHKMEEMCRAPTFLELKVGAQVILLQNQGEFHPGLVNGSVGIVEEFTTELADNRIWARSKNWPSIPPFQVPSERLPRVRFTVAGEYVHIVLGRSEWVLEAHGEDRVTKSVEGRRSQIPLCLAWAMTIHKSQGLTLAKVEVDLDKVFTTGQAYVALSRATSLDGLRVRNFRPEKVKVNPKAIAFYKQLDREGRDDRSSSDGEPPSADS